MSWFTNLKAEIVKVFHRSETEAHALVTALEADLQPVAADFEAKVVKAVEAAVAAGQIDFEAFAKAVAAEVAKILGNAPAEPPAAS